MFFSPKKLSKEFRRAAAVTLLTVAPLAMTGCDNKNSNDNKSQPTVSASVRTPPVVEDLCLFGCPTGAPTNDTLIRRSIYTLDNNPDTKFADWVGYEVTAQLIGGTQTRVWHKDPDLGRTETLSPKDYKDVREALHMDRGHQAPLASLTGSPDWEQADDLSNITPQSTDLNEGPWEHLEEKERVLARSGLTVYSVTGPLYERDMPSLPHSHLIEKTPSGYWKIVAVVKGNDVEAASFIMDQNSGREDAVCDKVVTMRVVEQRAHLHFFPKMNAAEREEIETRPGKLLPQMGCGR